MKRVHAWAYRNIQDELLKAAGTGTLTRRTPPLTRPLPGSRTWWKSTDVPVSWVGNITLRPLRFVAIAPGLDGYLQPRLTHNCPGLCVGEVVSPRAGTCIPYRERGEFYDIGCSAIQAAVEHLILALARRIDIFPGLGK